MGSLYSTTAVDGVDRQSHADRTLLQPMSSLLRDDPINWDLVRQSLRHTPEQACLYAHHVEPSPLHAAVSASCPADVAATLIDAYEDALDHPAAGGETVLHAAAGAASAAGDDGNSRLIVTLLARRKSMAGTVNRDGLLPLHRCRTSVGGARALIRAYPEGVTRRCRNAGSLPLHYVLAEEDPNVDLCRLLIQHSSAGPCRSAEEALPAGGILTRNKKGQTPLSILITHLDRTVDSAVESSSSDSSASSLDAETRHDELWDMLLSDWLPLLMKHDAETAAAASAPKGISNNHRHSANSKNHCNNDGHTNATTSSIPQLELHTLVGNACCHSKHLMDLALQRYRHQAFERDHLGRTPLHIAAELGSCSTAEALESLIRANPRAPRMTDNEGRLPIDWAAESPHTPPKTLSLLIKGEPRAVDTRDLRDGHYPFVSAAMGENTSVNNTYYLLRAKPHVLSYFHLP